MHNGRKMSEFIGRASELAEIRSAIDDACAGHGGLVLIAGEPGIGKTRLAQEACEHAIASGAATFWGRCVELEGTPAYWPWIQVLRGIAHRGDPRSWTAEIGDAAEVISRLVPEFGSEKPMAKQRPIEDGDRFRVFDAINGLLRWAGAAAGVVIVLDDLQWCDEASLALFRHVSPELSDMGALVIANYRDLEVGPGHPLSAALPELTRDRGARRLRLKGFEASEVRRYLVSSRSPAVAGAFASTILDRTGGNPFFVAQLARLLVQEGQLRQGALPQGVREVIGRRLDLISADSNRVLGVASVLGRDFELEHLCEIAQLPAQRVLELMDEAVGAALVSPRREAPGSYSFVHDLVRETVYQALPTPIRVQLHQIAAESLERAPEGGQLPALAHHWFAAAAGGSWQKAVTYAARAAEQAMEQLAYEEAARLRIMALDSLPIRPGHELRRCTLLLDLAEARYRSGDLSLSVKSCVEASGIARRLGRAVLQAKAALVVQGLVDFQLQSTLERLCEDALEAVGHRDLALRARLLSQLVRILEDGGRPERTGVLSKEAIDLAERCNDLEVIVSAIYARHAATTGPDGVDERLALGTRLLEVDNVGGRTVHTAWGRLWRIDALFQLGDLQAVDSELAELEVVAEQLRQPLFRWHLLRTRAVLAHATGRFGEAEGLTEAARTPGHADQHRIAEVLYRGTKAGIALELGNAPPIEEAIATYRAVMAGVAGDLGRTPAKDEAIEALEPMPRAMRPPLVVFAMTLELALGKEDQAKDLFEELMTSFPQLTPVSHWLGITAYLAEAAVDLGSREQIAALYEALTPYGGCFVASGAGAMFCLGSAARFLGVLAAALQHWDDAERHLKEAVKENTRAGALPFAAHAQMSLAEVLARRSEAGPALQMARSAARTAGRLGMKPLEKQALRLIGELARAYPRLSRRETEVASMVARGLNNRAIAESLHLSRRTAENHVTHILDKLGFDSRTQIATWAVAEGLVARREIEYRA